MRIVVTVRTGKCGKDMQGIAKNLKRLLHISKATKFSVHDRTISVKERLRIMSCSVFACCY